MNPVNTEFMIAKFTHEIKGNQAKMNFIEKLN